MLTKASAELWIKSDNRISSSTATELPLRSSCAEDVVESFSEISPTWLKIVGENTELGNTYKSMHSY